MISFAVSNIAWSPEEDDSGYASLLEAGITSIEAVPLRICPGGFDNPGEKVKPVQQKLDSLGLKISGFQSIFYGSNHLNLFDRQRKEELYRYFEQVLVLCAAVQGRYVVFGAPGSRKIPKEMNSAEALEIAAEFFAKFGLLAHQMDLSIGIEPIPSEYGCNFLNNIAEVAGFVRTVSTAGVHLHIDTGEMAVNNETIPDVIRENRDIIRSLHVSEPFLGDFSDPWPGHTDIAPLLKTYCGSNVFSLEMKRPASGMDGVRQAISFMKRIYS